MGSFEIPTVISLLPLSAPLYRARKLRFVRRYAVRELRQSLAVTIAIVLTLALGMGANTAIFSLRDWHPLGEKGHGLDPW